MNNNNTSIETCIRELKEMYESNNRLLISITQNYNDNYNILINSLNNSNNEIKNNILNLLNTIQTRENTLENTRDNTRQQTRENTRDNIRVQNRNNTRQQNTQNFIQNSGRRTNSFYNFWDPIEIYPSQTQIETATRIMRFGDIMNPLNSACPISLETFNENSYVSVIRYCNHIFNTNDLNIWFNSNCRCPVCRYDIRNYRLEQNTISRQEGITVLNEGIVDMSGNFIPNQSNNLERTSRAQNRLINMDTNSLTEFLVSSILNYPVPQANTTDISGNLLQFFFSST